MTLRRQHYLPGLLATALLHMAILYAFIQRQQAADVPRTTGPEIQWLLPMTTPPRPLDKSRPAIRPHAGSPPVTAVPSQSRAPSIQQPVTVDNPTPATQPPDDPFALPATAAQAPATAVDILRQAKLDLGKIDKDLRAAFPARPPSPTPDSKQAMLERGISAAHDAVGPKWFQAARITELTPPDARVRIYRITTGLGSYCISIDEGKKKYYLC